MKEIQIDRTFAVCPQVLIMRTSAIVCRLYHIPTGIVMLLALPPANLFQLTHEFHLEAVKRMGALVG